MVWIRFKKKEQINQHQIHKKENNNYQLSNEKRRGDKKKKINNKISITNTKHKPVEIIYLVENVNLELNVISLMEKKK